MLKTPVTPELANMLKTLRLQKNIQAKELKAFVEGEYAKMEDKEKYVAKAYETYLEYGEQYNSIRGEVIKKTIF